MWNVIVVGKHYESLRWQNCSCYPERSCCSAGDVVIL